MRVHALVSIITPVLAGCADPKPTDSGPPMTYSVTAPVTTAPVTTASQPASKPATQPEPPATQSTLPRVIVSEDGLHVEAEFDRAGQLNLPWIEVVALINPDQPGTIVADQKRPRTLDLTTRNVKRLRVDFNRSQLDRNKRVIVHLDQGRGMDLGRKRSSVYVFQRSRNGGWGIVKDPDEP
jgi:hypothetical protein